MRYAVNAWLGHQPTQLQLIDTLNGEVVAQIDGEPAARLVEEHYPELFEADSCRTHELIRHLFLQACIKNPPTPTSTGRG